MELTVSPLSPGIPGMPRGPNMAGPIGPRSPFDNTIIHQHLYSALLQHSRVKTTQYDCNENTTMQQFNMRNLRERKLKRADREKNGGAWPYLLTLQSFRAFCTSRALGSC